MTMVNIREFYEKDGKTLPGKAGINLPIEQFKTFLSLLPQLIDTLEEHGVEIEKPKFSSSARTVDAESENDEDEVVKPRKSNIETTSDEDEDD
jgi:hypothetical protein